MNLTEKILAKLDEYVHYNEGSPLWLALRRQVGKHTDNYGCTICCDFESSGGYEPHDQEKYPCTFIKEVATDLGIEVGE